jgi:hypothetical protein
MRFMACTSFLQTGFVLKEGLMTMTKLNIANSFALALVLGMLAKLAPVQGQNLRCAKWVSN